ncbi:hypothetical protein [Ruegeria arenilitoris]|uniref:hypothetical protein n=1 Tax=Ruegeria arenilitoris TaxID=1173585 RepID=UPI00147F04DD|nr:hypothetical protein [Ruegeria arenilitoris]
MNDSETRSLAVESVISACKQPVSEVIVLGGRNHSDWCDAYRLHGVAQVSHSTFGILAQSPQATDGLRIVHVTKGLPAASLSEAERSVSLITEIADIVVFTPVSATEQDVQDLLIAWPSFWAMLFLAEGFMLRDVVRPAIWNSFYSDWETLQSTVVFTNTKLGDAWAGSGDDGVSSVIDYVHPSTLEVNLKRLLALQTSAMLTPAFSDSSADSQSLAPKIHIALPKRYLKKDYEKKLFQEQRKWWKVALSAPWQASYWRDLWRLQRRTRRRMKSS